MQGCAHRAPLPRHLCTRSIRRVAQQWLGRGQGGKSSWESLLIPNPAENPFSSQTQLGIPSHPKPAPPEVWMPSPAQLVGAARSGSLAPAHLELLQQHHVRDLVLVLLGLLGLPVLLLGRVAVHGTHFEEAIWEQSRAEPGEAAAATRVSPAEPRSPRGRDTPGLDEGPTAGTGGGHVTACWLRDRL